MPSTSPPQSDDDISVPMAAVAEDHRRGAESAGPGLRGRLVAGFIVLVVAVGVMLYPEFQGSDEETTPPVPTEALIRPAAPDQSLPPAEDIPLVEVAPVGSLKPSVLDLRQESLAEDDEVPGPGEGDKLLREQLAGAELEPPLAAITGGEFLLQRTVALVDGGSRGLVLRKLLPLTPPAEAFAVEQDGGRVVISPESYARYDTYVDAAMALNTDTLVRTFHALRPLYERAYGELGLEPEAFDNAVIRTLDRVIDTPVLDQAPVLERRSVMYTYADPALEALPPLQKQLLRMGPDNLRRLQQRAVELRQKLLQGTL